MSLLIYNHVRQNATNIHSLAFWPVVSSTSDVLSASLPSFDWSIMTVGTREYSIMTVGTSEYP